MIAWEEIETRVQPDGRVRFDHPAFRSPWFERVYSPSSFELAEFAGYKTRQSPPGDMAANRASQAEQYLRVDPSGTKPSRPQPSQNFMATTVSAPWSPWCICAVISVLSGVILGFSQGAH